MLSGADFRSCFIFFGLIISWLALVGFVDSTEFLTPNSISNNDPAALLSQVKTANAGEIKTIQTELRQIAFDDFSEDDKEKLKTIIQKNGSHVQEWIKIAGFLQLCDFLEAIRYNYKDGTANKRALNLALTRCGVPEKVASLLRNVKELSITDDFVYNIAPQLIYTRQRSIVDHLFKIIVEDLGNCNSSGEYTMAISCSYRLMEMLSPIIIDFPFKLKTSGDLDTSDYKFALETVKKWYKTNKSIYQFEMNTY